MEQTKRKFTENVVEDQEQENKKAKVEDNVNNSSINGTTPPDTDSSPNYVDADGTQEYELQDSDGFDFNESLEILAQNTQDFTQENGIMIDSIDGNVNGFEDSNGNLVADSSEADMEDVIHTPGSKVKPSMCKVISVQRDAEVIKDIIPDIDVNKIYGKVLEHRSRENRVELVTNDILENGVDANAVEVIESESTDSDVVFNEVGEILVKYPQADPSLVYDLLQKNIHRNDRIQIVLDHLSSVVNSSSTSSSDSCVKNSSGSVISSDKSTNLSMTDSLSKTNPLYRDLKTLTKVLPEIDPNELYAYLEAHFDKANRVQIVIDELTKSDSQESLPLARLESVEDLDRGKEPVTVEDKLQQNLRELKEIFPDCDPNYLYEKLSENAEDPEKVGKIAMDLFENKNYPKLKDILETEEKRDSKQRLQDLVYNQDDFLVKFPDPVSYFSDINRHVNENYKTHVLAYLKNTFPFMKDGYFKKVLQKYNYHLAPSFTEVEKEVNVLGDRRSKKKRLTPRLEHIDYPDDPEELFFHEVLYCRHQDQIKALLRERRQEKLLKVEAARNKGELMECQCCFDDECLFEDMDTCSDGHLFCKECIQRSCEAAVGDGKTKFLCLTGTCEHQFPLKMLQEILPANLFSLALRKMQEEELQQADIPDLVSCPFCSFATIMPDQEDKVLNALTLIVLGTLVGCVKSRTISHYIVTKLKNRGRRT